MSESGSSEPEAGKSAEVVPPDDTKVMIETLTLNKPFRMRIKKESLKISYIEPGCQTVNKAMAGDTILAIDGRFIHSWEELGAVVKQPTTKANVTFRRRGFSWCRCKGNTVETLNIKNDPKVMRAIEVYLVRLVLNNFEGRVSGEEDELESLLGLQVAYDAKERIQIIRTNPDSLAAVHLRVNDIIREVDGHAVSSKAMLKYRIMEGIQKRAIVCLLVEAAIDSDEDESEDMPEDVVEIAKKQLQVQRSLRSREVVPTIHSILRSSSSSAERTSSAEKTASSISISSHIEEIPIASDFDKRQLKKVKKGQH